jgi:Anti-sigma-D factor RsdA to sigma factor binding region
MHDRDDFGSPDEGRAFGTAADLDFDLSMVHADDEYLDLLGGADLDDIDGLPDDQLSALLMSWRRDVETEPIGDLVDPKLASVTVHAARMRRKRRPRVLVPIAAAAAVLAIAFASIGLAARDAQPGDTLWALAKVLYSEHTRSVEAAEAVRADLREAKAALTEGRVDEAKSKLEDAHAALPTVSTEDGQKDLEKQHASLVAQLPGNPSGEAGNPPAPNPTTAPDTNPGSGNGSIPGTNPTSPSLPPTETTQPQLPDTSPPQSPDTTVPPTETSRNETTPASPGGEPVGEKPANQPAVEPELAPEE